MTRRTWPCGPGADGSEAAGMTGRQLPEVYW